MGTRREQINWSETIQQFAFRVLGDAARWVEIATLNDLAPPYISSPDNRSRRVAGYGDTVIIPGDPADLVEPTKTSTDDVFKVDVELNRKRLQAVNGDFTAVAGRANIKQALSHRIVTDEGELIFHPAYGCRIHRLKGARNDPARNLLGSKYVESALRSEARISDVVRSEAVVEGDSLHIEFEAMTVTGHPVDAALEV